MNEEAGTIVAQAPDRVTRYFRRANVWSVGAVGGYVIFGCALGLGYLWGWVGEPPIGVIGVYAISLLTALWVSFLLFQLRHNVVPRSASRFISRLLVAVNALALILLMAARFLKDARGLPGFLWHVVLWDLVAAFWLAIAARESGIFSGQLGEPAKVLSRFQPSEGLEAAGYYVLMFSGVIGMVELVIKQSILDACEFAFLGYSVAVAYSVLLFVRRRGQLRAIERES